MLWLGKILRKLFAPLIACFNWWYGKKQGNNSCLVLVPDSMNIFFVFLASTYLLPYTSMKTITFCSLALLFSPFILTGLLWVSAEKIFFLRLCCGIPYWCNWVERGQIFTLYEAWEDPAPSGVAFEDPNSDREPLHIGGVQSALPIYHFVGQTLAQMGWQQDIHGWRASAVTRD